MDQYPTCSLAEPFAEPFAAPFAVPVTMLAELSTQSIWRLWYNFKECSGHKLRVANPARVLVIETVHLRNPSTSSQISSSEPVLRSLLCELRR